MYSVHDKRVLVSKKEWKLRIVQIIISKENSQCNFWIEAYSPYSNQIEFDLD